jgi:hypothetical protein
LAFGANVGGSNPPGAALFIKDYFSVRVMGKQRVFFPQKNKNIACFSILIR